MEEDVLCGDPDDHFVHFHETRVRHAVHPRSGAGGEGDVVYAQGLFVEGGGDGRLVSDGWLGEEGCVEGIAQGRYEVDLGGDGRIRIEEGL